MKDYSSQVKIPRMERMFKKRLENEQKAVKKVSMSNNSPRDVTHSKTNRFTFHFTKIDSADST